MFHHRLFFFFFFFLVLIISSRNDRRYIGLLPGSFCWYTPSNLLVERKGKERDPWGEKIISEITLMGFLLLSSEYIGSFSSLPSASFSFLSFSPDRWRNRKETVHTPSEYRTPAPQCPPSTLLCFKGQSSDGKGRPTLGAGTQSLDAVSMRLFSLMRMQSVTRSFTYPWHQGEKEKKKKIAAKATFIDRRRRWRHRHIVRRRQRWPSPWFALLVWMRIIPASRSSRKEDQVEWNHWRRRRRRFDVAMCQLLQRCRMYQSLKEISYNFQSQIDEQMRCSRRLRLPWSEIKCTTCISCFSSSSI